MSSVLLKRKPQKDNNNKTPLITAKSENNLNEENNDGNSRWNQLFIGSIWKHIARKLIFSTLILLIIFGYFHLRPHSIDSYQTMASVGDKIDGSPLAQEVACPRDNYQLEREQFANCAPGRCGRFVSDSIVSENEALQLRLLAETVFSISQPSGGVAIFDLNSGALSNHTKFINLFELIKRKNINIIQPKSLQTFKNVKNKIIHNISFQFGVSPQHLHLTSPVFFTRITNAKAATLNDQYWHPHVDKVTYGTFAYTSLVYLSNYKEEFRGGRFIFLDSKQNITVEPRFGRVSAFTSSSENVHMVEPVNHGTRFALTIPFTCDPKQAIENPKLK